MKKGTIRKISAVALVVVMLGGICAGCGKKEEKKTTKVQKNEIVSEFSVTTIQNTANQLSDFVSEIKAEKDYQPKEFTLTYDNVTSTIKTNEKFMDLKTGTMTVSSDTKAKKLLNADNIPNVSLTFKEVTAEAQELKVKVVFENKKKEIVEKETVIKINVVPESMKVVKQLTDNQKISEKVKQYDFDVYAKNIADSVKDAAATAKVKSSNVKFGTPGHYEVVYEVTVTPTPAPDTEPKPETGDIPVDVEIVDKDHADKDDVIMENVKPEEMKPEENKPEDNVPSGSTEESGGDVADGGNSSGGNTADNGNSSEGGNTSAGGGNSSSGGGNSSSGGGGASEPSHTHNWVAHTASKQVWVPNIVVVDDYETQNVKVGFNVVCNCGAKFRDGAGHETHAMNHILAGEPDNCWEEDIYEQQTVKVGSHEEDHGYYKEETYTDYTYCSDCGARQ